MRTTIAIALALASASCAATTPRPVPPPTVVAIPFEQKMSWILRLEDQRILRDAPPPVSPGGTLSITVPEQRRPATEPAVVKSAEPDLVQLLSDGEARIRRRAALAIGHVGLRAGVAPLITVLSDPDPEVRQIAAFGLGLIGDAGARDALVTALGDMSPLVQGSAAEALGLIGDKSAADAVGRLAAQVVDSGVLAMPPGDDVDVRRDVPAAAFRLAMTALVRLDAYDQLAAAVLDPFGQPRVRWWPVAFALQRLANPKALPALLTLAKDTEPYTRTFAIKGLGAVKDPSAVPALLPLLINGDRNVVIETVRALGRIGAPSAASPLMRVMQTRGVDQTVRVEAIAALGALHAPGTLDIVLDYLTDPSPSIRSAALQSAAALEPDQFVAVLSGLEPDPNWQVRGVLASVLGTLPQEAALPRLTAMLADQDQRVVPFVVEALVKLRPPNIAETLTQRLTAEDPAVRAAAATGLGEVKPPSAAPALIAAYEAGQRDASYSVRAAALSALAKFGAQAATPTLKEALADKDWAVRVRAAQLLGMLDPASARDVERQIRPAPANVLPDAFAATRLVTPAVSLIAYIETDRGIIQVELAVLDAPLTVENFVTLARRGYFNGLSAHRVIANFVVQTGDPRGDGEGGPGYTIRDELNQLPFLRGTVGMALDVWPDSGGSQFFIAHSPQPHLDARYTVFGRVVMGMDVVDQIQQGDIIRRVRIWDGVNMTRADF
jgi:HEAT repeat protein/cyclophilin family peptidyl-prolyl cis-trans isomerase